MPRSPEINNYDIIIWQEVWEKASYAAEGKGWSKTSIVLQLSADLGISEASIWRCLRGRTTIWNERTREIFLNYIGFRDINEFIAHIASKAEFTAEKKITNLNATVQSQNKIRLSTRRNILDGFLITRISWFGQLNQLSFLGRLYDLSKLPSSDLRFSTAKEDIYKHTVANDDWPDEWIFTDDRFNLLHSSDNDFMNFLCYTIHPIVRQNNEELTTLIEVYTNNLNRDGFILEKIGEINGKPIFTYAELSSHTLNSTSTIVSNNLRSEVRRALVIGCSKYEYANSLVNPINDANGMEITLQKLGFEVTKKINPSQRELKISIDEFGGKLKGSDVGLLYFAGHGVQLKGLNYLIPVDANLVSEKLVEYDCVEAGRILAHMEEAKTAVNIIIFDACRNNPFERHWGRGIGQRGLASMNAPKGSLIAYSTAPGNTAHDGDGNNGLYTEALLNNIGAKGIPINTMFQKVRLEVMVKSKEEQIPWEATSLTADFYFNREF